ncbi:MAG TPA: dienelactone hydrolase family protein [Allosphingosinicella sp.]|uniref:dienelactone hydrolase family protein n=1 Tax=Allosphingosinicella sp. TaxID=2823234 RepID=UPI002ED8C7E4
MNKDLRQAAIDLYDRYTHEGMDRRLFMAELTKIAGGAAAANALLVGIAANPAAAAIVPADDPRLQTRTIQWELIPGRRMSGYGAAPVNANPKSPLVIVIHENRGLNEHIRDVARRVALAGFSAVAPDFLTPVGGTPADETQAREMIGKLDLAATVADGRAFIDWLSSPAGGSRRVGAVGFCWGGGMVNRLAVAAGSSLTAGVSFYGPAPDPTEAAKVEAAMLIQLAELDERVNATALPWIAALKAAGKNVTSHIYPGVNHAFHNDTSVERYSAAAAKIAWDNTIGFFTQNLDTIVVAA